MTKARDLSKILATNVDTSDIGVTVQAQDPELNQWATKSAPTGFAVGTTDSQTLSNKTLVDMVLTGSYTEDVYALVGTDIDPTNGTVQTLALSAPITLTESLADGQTVVLMITGGDTHAVTWPTMTWATNAGNVAPTLTAASTVVMWQVAGTVYGAYVGSYA